jgi:hypothetical protein
VGQALLLGEGERVLGQEAVADQDPGEVLARDLDDHLMGPAPADAVERGVLGGEDHSQAERPPIFQPVSSTCWTTLVLAASTCASYAGWASLRRRWPLRAKASEATMPVRVNVLALVSFGIEAAKDVLILNNQKVPGIGPVYSRRLLDWKESLEKSFRPQPFLPESEKNRIASRYTPILLPLGQSIECAIDDLSAIIKDYGSQEDDMVREITVSV